MRTATAPPGTPVRLAVELVATPAQAVECREGRRELVIRTVVPARATQAIIVASSGRTRAPRETTLLRGPFQATCDPWAVPELRGRKIGRDHCQDDHRLARRARYPQTTDRHTCVTTSRAVELNKDPRRAHESLVHPTRELAPVWPLATATSGRRRVVAVFRTLAAQ